MDSSMFEPPFIVAQEYHSLEASALELKVPADKSKELTKLLGEQHIDFLFWNKDEVTSVPSTSFAELEFTSYVDKTFAEEILNVL